MTEWISVKDRLPPEKHEVLYFATTNQGMTKEIMTGHRENGFWTHCCMFYSTQTLNHLVKVTHWMELPNYPKINHPEPEEISVEALLDMPIREDITVADARKFAEKFVTRNKDLLKRLADK